MLFECPRKNIRVHKSYVHATSHRFINGMFNWANWWREHTRIESLSFSEAENQRSNLGILAIISKRDAENSMFPGGFNAVLTDWQIPRLNGAKSFHQDTRTIHFYSLLWIYCSASVAIYAGNLSKLRPLENLTYHRSPTTNEIVANYF